MCEQNDRSPDVPATVPRIETVPVRDRAAYDMAYRWTLRAALIGAKTRLLPACPATPRFALGTEQGQQTRRVYLELALQQKLHLGTPGTAAATGLALWHIALRYWGWRPRCPSGTEATV